MRLAAALALAILLVSALAQASEEVMTFPSEGQAVVGTLLLPEGDPAPVVLLLHGFTGSRDEMAIPGTDEGVFSRTARLLAEGGYASLRIDFRGSGESTAELSFADTTFEGQVADALAAVEYLRALETVQADGGRLREGAVSYVFARQWYSPVSRTCSQPSGETCGSSAGSGA